MSSPSPVVGALENVAAALGVSLETLLLAQIITRPRGTAGDEVSVSTGFSRSDEDEDPLARIESTQSGFGGAPVTRAFALAVLFLGFRARAQRRARGAAIAFTRRYWDAMPGPKPSHPALPVLRGPGSRPRSRRQGCP